MAADLSLADPHTVPTRLLAPARRRPHPVRRLPAGLQAARGPAGRVLRAGPHRRPGRAHHLRPLERLLHRPDREEAAEPLPARHVGAVVRHRRLQPGLPLLPELGHLEVEGDRPARRRGRARGHRPRPRSTSGCRSVAFTYNDPTIFLEYAVDIADACHEVGVQAGRGDGRATSCDEPRRELYRAHRRGQHRPQGRSPRTSTGTSPWATSQPVLDTLRYLRHETDVWFEITTLLIPGPQRQRRRARRDDARGSPTSSGPTCRCTSPRSTPTTRCSTCRPRRRRR